MKATGRTNTWDLLVISPSDDTAPHAQQICAALETRGFRVRIAGASPESSPVLSTAVQAEVGSAAFSLALSCEAGVTRYAFIPAPLYVGQEPRFAARGKRARVGEIAIGVVEADARALVERIAERLRIGR